MVKGNKKNLNKRKKEKIKQKWKEKCQREVRKKKRKEKEFASLFELSKSHWSQSIKIQSTFPLNRPRAGQILIYYRLEKKSTDRQAQMDERPQLQSLRHPVLYRLLFKSSVLLCLTLVFLSCVFGWFVFWLKRKRRIGAQSCGQLHHGDPPLLWVLNQNRPTCLHHNWSASKGGWRLISWIHIYSICEIWVQLAARHQSHSLIR